MQTENTTRKLECTAQQSADAIIELQFERLWDLLSAAQRQYALHLSRPTEFQPISESKSEFVAMSWRALPHERRTDVLHAFSELPGVHSIIADSIA